MRFPREPAHIPLRDTERARKLRTMYETLLPPLLLLAAFYFWHNALRARERARYLAHALCARVGLQLLDQTVALRRVRLRRIPGEGLRLLRCYRFDVSTDGNDRRDGSLDMIDGDVISYDLPANASAPTQASGNVIELRPTRVN
jgi:hypothetical protein